MLNFGELGLAEPLLRAINHLGHTDATPIQAEAIPAILAGRDLVGCAQTGTGKTAAFTLPMLQRLWQTLPPKPEQQPARSQRSGRRGPPTRPCMLRALVLSPTRELASQIFESLKKYGRHTPLRHGVIFGGVSQVPQVKTLWAGVDCLVATPGRLLDLMNQGHIDLSNIEILVLDEADQMMDMGFMPDIKRIISAVPEERQTLLFSATMPAAIRQLADGWLKSPVNVQIGSIETPVERITQSVHLVEKKQKPDFLAWYLNETPRSRTMVFSRTKHGADKIVQRLERAGVRAVAIHGNKSQGARTRSLEQFKGKNPPVLVATDIAARGLDIPAVSHIVNYDLPETPETYVHRIGRTARAGASGVAISFCAGDERNLLSQIERHVKFRLTLEGAVDGFDRPAEPVRRDDAPGRGPKNGRGRRPGPKPPGARYNSNSEGGPKPGASNNGAAKYGSSKPGAPKPGAPKRAGKPAFGHGIVTGQANGNAQEGASNRDAQGEGTSEAPRKRGPKKFGPKRGEFAKFGPNGKKAHGSYRATSYAAGITDAPRLEGTGEGTATTSRPAKPRRPKGAGGFKAKSGGPKPGGGKRFGGPKPGGQGRKPSGPKA
jgi:ATP-dependent RNA helicase RhlE